MDPSRVLCSFCGHENPDNASFSAQRAGRLAMTGDEAADVPETVTVVFCDLVGSTALGERTVIARHQLAHQFGIRTRPDGPADAVASRGARSSTTVASAASSSSSSGARPT
jgi:hypothetical protein